MLRAHGNVPPGFGWRDRRIPKREWQCYMVVDRGHGELHQCEMCSYEYVRYVHVMRHDDYHKDMEVGCICAGKMQNDLEAARAMERVVRNRSARRAHFIKRKWKRSDKGNEYLNVDGFNVVVFPRGSGWSYRAVERRSGEELLAKGLKRSYASSDAAKLAAFDRVFS